MPFHPPSGHPPLPSPFSTYKIRGGECSPPLPSCLAFTDVHDIEMDFLSYISIEIEIISDD